MSDERPGFLARVTFSFRGRGRLFQSAVWALVATVMGALFFAYLSAGEIYDYQDSVDGVHLPQIDAIVVLAGGRGRIAAAGDLWYRYWELSQAPIKGAGRSPVPTKPPILYFSGMGPQTNWNVLKKQVRRGVYNVLQPEDVVLEKESSNTDENARWLIRYAKDRGWDRILLVTSSYHMKRAKFMFDQVMARMQHPIQVETLSVYQEPFEPDEWRSGLQGIRVTIIEYLKLIWYRKFWHP